MLLIGSDCNSVSPTKNEVIVADNVIAPFRSVRS